METQGIGGILQSLMDKHRTNPTDVAAATGIPKQTVYSMVKKTSYQVDIVSLKKIADHFKEDFSIFFNNPNYEKPLQLTEDEKFVITTYRKISAAGKKKINDYVVDVGTDPRYKTGR